MTTARQATTNAENAKLSTGPRTEEGRAASAQNALKHGLSARKYLLPDEDPAEFEDFVADARETYRPANRQEDEMVVQIAISTLRLRRLGRAECSTFSTIPLEQSCSLQPQVIKSLALHEGTIRKTLSMLEDRLERLQAARRRREAEEEPFEAGMMSREEYASLGKERVVTV
jgi:hypothetical protein